MSGFGHPFSVSGSNSGGGQAGATTSSNIPSSSFAQHIRSNSVNSSPSANRRVAHHGSVAPSGLGNYARPHAPLTASGPGSRAPSVPTPYPASARPIQQLSLLSSSTPVCLAKISVPPSTKIHWRRFSPPAIASPSRPHAQQNDQLDSAGPSKQAEATSDETPIQAWTRALRELLSLVGEMNLGNTVQESQDAASSPFGRMFKHPLFSTQRPTSSKAGSNFPMSDLDAARDLWIFTAEQDETEAPSQSAATEHQSSSKSKLPQTSKDAASTNQASSGASTPTSAQQPKGSAAYASLPQSVIQALMRVASVANIYSGSYSLTQVAQSSGIDKGKLPLLSFEQDLAHRLFLRALKKETVAVILKGDDPGSSCRNSSKASTVRRRLPLNDDIVFTSAADALSSISQLEASSGFAAQLPKDTDEYSLIASFNVSVCDHIIYLHASIRKLPAVSLKSTPYDKTSSTTPQPVLLAPVGMQASMVAIIKSSSLEAELRSAVQSTFAPSWTGLGDPLRDTEEWAVCTFNTGHTQSSPQERFIWPACLCLALQQSFSSILSNAQRHVPAKSRNDCLLAQPSTPLKELAAFTLKVLKDTGPSCDTPFAPGERDEITTSPRKLVSSPVKMDSLPTTASYPSFATPMPASKVDTTSEASPKKLDTTQGPPTSSSTTFNQAIGVLSWMQFDFADNNEAQSDPTNQREPQDTGASDQTTPRVAKEESLLHKSGLQGSESLHQQAVYPDTTQQRQSRATLQHQSGSTSQHQLTTDGVRQPESRTPMHGDSHSDQSSHKFLQPQRKAGESDVFSNLGLLTEDDFSFFDESAFGFDSDLSNLPALGTSAQDSNSQASAQLGQGYDHQAQTLAEQTDHDERTLQSAKSQRHHMDPVSADVTMGDVDQNSLDALFSTMPAIGDAMMTSEPSHTDYERAEGRHDDREASYEGGLREPIAATTMLPANHSHPSLRSYTPRDVSSTTSFGDPASLPGFTPSSLTESSPAFGHSHYKTPRTPYSPDEEYRDTATIVESYGPNLPPSFRPHYLEGVDHTQAIPLDKEGLPYNGVNQALAASPDSGVADGKEKKRPPIVPLPFLPIEQREPRKPLIKLTAAAKAPLGRKYDLLGKFASRPKVSTDAAVKIAHKDANRSDRLQGSRSFDQGRQTRPRLLETRSSETRSSPTNLLARRGQGLFRLRIGRHKMPSSGGAHSRNRIADSAYTPRSSDDLAGRDVASVTDSDDSSSEDDSSDESSDAEGTASLLLPNIQALMVHKSSEIVSQCIKLRALGANLLLLRQELTSEASNAHRSTPRGLVVKPQLLHRTAHWLVENPQFRALYGYRRRSLPSAPEVSAGDRLEVLDTMMTALGLSDDDDEAEPQAPTLGDLASTEMKSTSKDSSKQIGQLDSASVVEILEPTRIGVGCEGSVLEALPSALTLWDKTKLSAVGGPKYVVAKVLLTHASAAWHEEITAWLDRLQDVFQNFGLGTHERGTNAILAVADEQTTDLSSHLDSLINDGEAWLDTLRSLSSRFQQPLLEGKHVVLYTLQCPNSPSCQQTGYHGLLRFESDLKALLRDQVGALSEHLVVRPISPAMLTESGSLGFGQQSQSLRRLAFSVYDQLARLTRRQPGKVLHGQEPGPISALVQFPAFSLCSEPVSASRSHFSLQWPQGTGSSMDDGMLLHIAYSMPSTASLNERGGSSPLIVVSSIDEKANTHNVDVWQAESTLERMVESIFRFVLAEAGKARVKWRVIIAKAGLVTRREEAAWTWLFRKYRSKVAADQICATSFTLYSVRADSGGGIITEVATQIRPAQDWTKQLTSSGADNKASSVLLEASDYSQVVRFGHPVPLTWTSASESMTQDAIELNGSDLCAIPILSSILVHKPKRSNLDVQNALLSQSGMGMMKREGEQHVLAIDLITSRSTKIEDWETIEYPDSSTSTALGAAVSGDNKTGQAVMDDGIVTTSAEGTSQAMKEKARSEDQDMKDVTRNLHDLRLISEERHQLPSPWNHLPWHVGVVEMLRSCLGDVTLET